MYNNNNNYEPYDNNREWTVYQNAASNFRAEPQPLPGPNLSGGGKKRGGGKGGLVAILVAVSLVSGMAGGGASYYILNSSGESALVEGAQQPVQQESAAPSEMPAVTGDGGGSEAVATDIAGIVAKVSDSVVEVNTKVVVNNYFFGATESAGSGSGVIYSADGYIVTNNHVVEDATSITVRTSDGEEYEAALIGTDEKTDLAVLKIEASGLNAVELADSDSIRVGESVVAIGNPLGTLGGTVTDGIISAVNREVTIDKTTMHLLQTSAAVNPGNSGGGLFNAQGQLIGVVNAKSSGSEIEGLGFAIPSNTVRQVVGDLMENGYVTGRPELGVSLVDITDLRTARRYGLTETGIYVTAVNRDNGLEPGDKIVSVDGTPITSSSDLKQIIDSSAVGDTLQMEIKRNGATMTVPVTLAEQAPLTVEELPQNAEL